MASVDEAHEMLEAVLWEAHDCDVSDCIARFEANHYQCPTCGDWLPKNPPLDQPLLCACAAPAAAPRAGGEDDEHFQCAEWCRGGEPHCFKDVQPWPCPTVAAAREAARGEEEPG